MNASPAPTRDSLPPYCLSRFSSVRRQSHVVHVGAVPVGGLHPLVVQSMTTTPTQDVAATVAQCIALAEAGCQIIRITAQNVQAARALGEIRKNFSRAGFADVPLVADIHFLPQAAMEAVEHVEKVRINPGNYADKKRFQVREYSESDYQEELERLHEAFSPIVLRCKELGRAMRIGTNHGSLSDRIVNRYGDSPEGMCESALEFLRIAESHDYRDIIISMKASNPKVMIHAYRLIAARMTEASMTYPLHLGVTEAGDGDDARIKSAIGIGSLLYDGLGDTLRVSLTEDPVAEIPVAQALAEKAHRLWTKIPARTTPDPIDPFTFSRRTITPFAPGGSCKLSTLEPPRVIQAVPATTPETLESALSEIQQHFPDTPVEGVLIPLDQREAMPAIPRLREIVARHAGFCVWELRGISVGQAENANWSTCRDDILLAYIGGHELNILEQALRLAEQENLILALNIDPVELPAFAAELAATSARIIFTLGSPDSVSQVHPVGAYRQLAEVIDALGLKAPIWIRNTAANSIESHNWFGDQLLEASLLSGPLLCDGIGDLISVENVSDPAQSLTLAYNILQGARARTSKTEYVACPSCGRTLFDLQSTTQRIRAATGHLKGVTIAVMGCIVNGPGEMADADFGYVGGAPGKVNLYVGKECVKYHIPAEHAVDALIALIKEKDRWIEPPAATMVTAS